jgi:hypothetical protein
LYAAKNFGEGIPAQLGDWLNFERHPQNWSWLRTVRCWKVVCLSLCRPFLELEL